MDHEISKYIQRHTFLITMVMVITLVLLASGEFYLYRKHMELNKMVSEGLMQIKEKIK